MQLNLTLKTPIEFELFGAGKYHKKELVDPDIKILCGFCL